MNRLACIIPSRFNSSRFPGKALVKINGREMVLRVVDICKQAFGLESVYVATDDDRIARTVKAEGYKTLMTGSDCMTGADRVSEASRQIKCDMVVSVQGDEPLLDPNDIIMAVQFKVNHCQASIVNCMTECDPIETQSPNTIKVVFNKQRDLIYASRSVIPYWTKPEAMRVTKRFKQVCISVYEKQQLIGLYGYHASKSPMETVEDIDILRFLDHGINVRMYELHPKNRMQSVDVPEDVKTVEDILNGIVKKDVFDESKDD